jgi:hypothetical protein
MRDQRILDQSSRAIRAGSECDVLSDGEGPRVQLVRNARRVTVCVDAHGSEALPEGQFHARSDVVVQRVAPAKLCLDGTRIARRGSFTRGEGTRDQVGGHILWKPADFAGRDPVLGALACPLDDERNVFGGRVDR